MIWGMRPVKDLFNSVGQVQFGFPGLHNVILDKGGKPLSHIFKFNYLSASGTAILLSSIIAIPLIGLKFSDRIKVFISTLKQLRFPIVTIASVLAFAYIVNDSGITITLAQPLANTGVLFPFFAPILGWLGVFITGSDTSANALFGKLQASTATSIGVDPVVTVAANASGGVMGKMISPQSIAIAAAAGNLVGKESELFRFTFKHSLFMLLLICFIVMAQAYIFTWLIPHYQTPVTSTVPLPVDFSKKYIYLLLSAVVLVVIILLIIKMTRKKIVNSGKSSS